MTDKNNNSNPLDEFFRRKAAEYDECSWNEKDWLKLESRLEARDQLAENRKRKLFLSAATVLILSLLSYYTWRNNTELNELSRLLTQGQTGMPSVTPPVIPPETESPELQNLSVEAFNERMAAEGTRDPGAASIAQRTDNGENESGSSAPAGSASEESPSGSEFFGNSVADGNSGETGMEAGVTAVPIGDDEEFLLSCPECTFSTVPVRFLLIDYEHPPAEPIASGDVGMETYENNPGRNYPGNIPRFSFGVNVSPDLSTAGELSNYTNPGYRLGLTLDYRLSRSLSLSTGFIYSSVNYQAAKGHYHPPAGYWGDSVQPYSTLAECILIDIPLSLKLDLWQSGRSGFYTSAGLSTYIMLNEEYQFSYYNVQDGLSSEWNDRTGTVHPLSNASFSIGYELELRQNISIRAEPYIRLPLRDVGWGNVRLYSFGSLFSINYHFL